uniref:Leucine rich immune protein (Coil-less) n=1 Tax=Anopheles culicifacies TaxID=139723 RepID=A0A182M199_9DIPT
MHVVFTTGKRIPWTVMKIFGLSPCGMLWLVVDLMQCSVSSAGDGLKCRERIPNACTLRLVRVSNESWIDQLATATANYTTKLTIIRRCVLFNRISVQKVLEATSLLFNQTTLQQYHEQDLTITNRMASESLELLSAPLLTHLAFVPNRHLSSLYIVNSAVRRIPESITNLYNLRFLGIDKGYIRVLDLGLLCSLRKLKTLQLSKNHISLLLPATKSTCASALQDLYLEENHLTTLDMALLAPFVSVERLFLQHNLMKALLCSKATDFPLLQLLVLGPGNNLSWIELDQLRLSASFTLTLPDNQIKQLPSLNHSNIPRLARVYLDGNQLATVDLAQFQKHQQIDSFHFSRNQLHSVACRQNVHLPLLDTMELSTNKLEYISLENCSFPNLHYLALGNNRIQRVPAEIYVSDVSPACVLNIQNNPIRCSSLRQHVKLLTTPSFYPKLLVTTAGKCADMNYNGRIPMSNLCDSRKMCRIAELDLTDTPDGLNALERAPSTSYTSIQIQRLIMGSTTIATLLVNASSLTSNLYFKKYHEKILFLPSALTLEMLTLEEARNLQTITIQTNRHLKQLDITDCALSMIPASIRNLISLKELRIKVCALRTLNLGLLASLKNLETVQLVANNITSIYPPQIATVWSIRTIDLSFNALRQVDMAAFRSLKRMNTLNLANNRLSTIDYPPSGVVTLPALTILYLTRNMIERISFVQLNASNLEYLELTSNRLPIVPEQIDKFAKLIHLSLGRNGLESFDFSILERHTNLQNLELYSNRIRSIDVPKEIELPNLNLLSLSNNQLQSIALEQLTAPRLSFLDLSNNRLTVIPDVFAKNAKLLQSVNVIGNPLTCGTYERFRKFIRLKIILPKWVSPKGELCSTGKYFVLSTTQRVCCMT